MIFHLILGFLLAVVVVHAYSIHLISDTIRSLNGTNEAQSKRISRLEAKMRPRFEILPTHTAEQVQEILDAAGRLPGPQTVYADHGLYFEKTLTIPENVTVDCSRVPSHDPDPAA